MLVSAITARVSEILQDDASLTWTGAQLLQWVNDALRSVTLVRPDSTSVTASVLLVAGTLQTLTGTNDLRLIRVIRNMGAAGATPGNAIRIGDMPAMDLLNPAWHTEAQQATITEYMYDDTRPKEFWVYPPAAVPSYVQLSKSVLPTAVTAVGDTLPVDDIYGPAIIEWCCYRAFSRDSEETPNWQRAARHFSAFFNLLQVKVSADMAINPNVRAKVAQ